MICESEDFISKQYLCMIFSDAINPRPSTSVAGAQPLSDPRETRRELSSRLECWLPALVLVAGFIARLIPAWRYFLNPDEALHNLLASQPSLKLAYSAALTNAHPPLLILLLYYVRYFGHSELLLRMPSVLAGTACCWMGYQWLKRVTNPFTACIGLSLLAFSPTLIELSAEIRQYALLLFFAASCLYLSERAIQEGSRFCMALFSLSLYGALLTHYSSLIFAFAVGIYMLVRLHPYTRRMGLFATWACGQIGALALTAYFLVTHVARLRASGMPQGIAETWLRKSIFHAGENNVAGFISLQTLRVFTYLFSHGLVGTLALLAFVGGLVALVTGKTMRNEAGPTQREIALLLSVPFIVNCAAALAGLYPYGGTRHDSFLALFAMAAASIGIATWIPARPGTKLLAVFAALALCNLFPAPPPPIRSRNHSRTLMNHAVQSLWQAAPPGSILLADYQSGLLLGYYACGHPVVQTFPPLQPFAKFDCGRYTVITSRPQEWKFYADDLRSQWAQMAETYGITPGTRVWLFDAGWITDSAPAIQKGNREFGCAFPQNFGENILFCGLTGIGSNPSLHNLPVAK